MAKVCFVTDYMGLGGVARAVLNLAHEFVAKGHQVSIITLYPVTDYDVDESILSVHCINPRHGAFNADIKQRFAHNQFMYALLRNLKRTVNELRTRGSEVRILPGAPYQSLYAVSY